MPPPLWSARSDAGFQQFVDGRNGLLVLYRKLLLPNRQHLTGALAPATGGHCARIGGYCTLLFRCSIFKVQARAFNNSHLMCGVGGYF